MAATMGMILDIGTCKTKRVSDENFSPYPLIVTPRHSGFDAGRRQNTNAQACLIAAYQDYCFTNCTSIKGKLTVTKAVRNVDGGNIFGATWFSTPTGSIEAHPKSGITSIYYSTNYNLIGVDVSALFKTINTKYGFNTTARQLSTPIKLIVNGKEVNLYSEVYTKKDGLISQGYKNAKDQYTFQAKPNSGDLLNLTNLVGQTVDFEIIW